MTPRLDAAQDHLLPGRQRRCQRLRAVCASLLVQNHSFNAAFFLAAGFILIGFLVVPSRSQRIPSRPKMSAPVPSTVAVPIVMSAQKRAKIIAALTLAMMLFTVGFRAKSKARSSLWAQDQTDRILFGFRDSRCMVCRSAFLPCVALGSGAARTSSQDSTTRWSTPQLIALWVRCLAGVCADDSARTLKPGHRVSMLWLLSCMTLLVVGELPIGPLGLPSLVRPAPTAIRRCSDGESGT